MSTYYAIVCRDCNEIADACSRTAGGIGNAPVGDSQLTLRPFLIHHMGHRLECISEYHPDWCNDEETPVWWTETNLEEMRMRDEKKPKPDGPSRPDRVHP